MPFWGLDIDLEASKARKGRSPLRALNSVNQPARARPQKLTIPEYLQLPSRRSGSGTKLPEAAAIGNVRPHRNRSFVGPRKLTFLRLAWWTLPTVSF